MSNNLDVQQFIDNIINSVSDRADIEDNEFNILSTNGIMLDGMTEVLENAIYKYQEATRERFISTSERRSSIIKHGYRFKTDARYAEPASMNAMIILETNELVNISDQLSEDVYEYTFPKNFEFSIGDYYFTLDYDIKINLYEDNDDNYIIKSAYEMDSQNPLSKVTNPNIKTIQFKNLGVDYVGLITTIRQFKRSDMEFTFFSRFSDRNFIAPFNDQLAAFNIYYKENNNSQEEMINKTNNLVTTNELKDKTLFYEFKSEDELLIMNRFEMGNFIPESNSKFRVEILETLGKEGNFSYSGDYIQTKNPDGLSTKISPRGDAIGGNDTPDIAEMKEELIDYNTRRDGITSTPDLERVLENVDSKYKILKYKDDVFYRIYNIFSLLYDKEGRVIPTNTLNTSINASDMIKQTKDISEGIDTHQIVDYILPNDHIINLDTDADGNPIGTSNNISSTHEYKYPYKMVYSYTDDGQYINDTRIFKTLIDKSYDLDYEFINQYIPINYMVNNINFKCDGNYDYNISFELRSNTAYPVDFIHSFIIDEEHLTDAEGKKLFTMVDDTGDDVVVNEDYTEIEETAIEKNIIAVNSLDSFTVSDNIDLNLDDEFYLYIGSNKYDNQVRRIYEINESGTDYNIITERETVPTDLTTEEITDLKLVIINRSDVYDLNLEPMMEYEYGIERSSPDDELIDEDHIRPILIIKENDDFQGYIDFNMDDYKSEGDYYEYSSGFNFLSEIDSYGNISVELYDSNHDLVEVELSVEDLEFELYVITRDEIDETIDYNVPISLSSFTLSNVFNFKGSLFEDLSYLNRLQVNPIYADGDFDQLEVSMMPLVSSNYFNNYGEFLLDKIDRNIDTLTSVYQSIEDDFQISLLFMNTFGSSRYFELGLDNSKLDRINISMDIRIRVEQDMSISRKELRDFIISYIDSIDFLSYENFHVSKLIKEIKSEFEAVEFIEFRGINGESPEHQLLAIDSGVENSSMVPEYLNVFYKTENNELVPDIDIAFV